MANSVNYQHFKTLLSFKTPFDIPSAPLSKQSAETV